MNPTALDSAIPAAHDLSLLGLFLQADPIVKAVMLFLVLVSVICWGIIFDKIARMLKAREAVRQVETAIRSDAVFADSSRFEGVSQAILGAGLREWLDPARDESRAERRERIERAMRETAAGELRKLEPGLSFLATVGSTAPFIGLFLQADPIVKAVMLFLLLVSVICWGIIFDKIVRLLRARDALPGRRHRGDFRRQRTRLSQRGVGGREAEIRGHRFRAMRPCDGHAFESRIRIGLLFGRGQQPVALGGAL
jgi:biopolymer transport protein ExbB/TolQ